MRGHLDRLSPTDDSWESNVSPIAKVVVDALLLNDAATLEELMELLQHATADLAGVPQDHGPEIRGCLLGLLSAARWGFQQLPDLSDIEVPEDSLARKMLEALAGGTLTSKELRIKLGTGNSQLSRAGRTLLATQLVVQRRAGREAVWEIRPLGQRLLRGSAERGRRVR